MEYKYYAEGGKHRNGFELGRLDVNSSSRESLADLVRASILQGYNHITVSIEESEETNDRER